MMMKRLTLSSLLLAATLLTACERQPVATQAPDSAPETVSHTGPHTKSEKAADLLLTFEVHERGVEPYPARIIVSPDFLRIEDSDNENDFVLFDRKARKIYSVSADNVSILEIKERPVTVESPLKLDVKQSAQVDEEAPKIGGMQGKHFVLRVNGESCIEAFVVEDFLEPARDALRDYYAILAGEHATALVRTPPDMLNACDIAKHIFYPGAHLAYGFPIREWSTQGSSYQRLLVDYDANYRADPKLFELPADFGRYSIDDLTPKEALPGTEIAPLGSDE